MRRDPGLTAVGVLAGGLVVLLGVLVALRTPFRCDLLVWSEAPFMVDMMKLARGRSVYAPPTDVNSFVYAPGLQWLTYAVLAPFGKALDVRWCRVVSMLIGLGAAATFAALTAGVARALDRAGRGRRSFGLGLLVATLLVFGNFTSDVPHPDNLNMLHAILTLLLTVVALRRGSFAIAATAMAVAGIGVLVKQPAALSAVGAGAALLLARRWGRRRALALAAVGAGVTAGALLAVLGPPAGRYFAFQVVATQKVQLEKVVMLAYELGHGHRLILMTVAVPAMLYLLRTGGDEARRLLLAWACLGVTTVLPALLPFLKIEGSTNNLAILMLWLLVPCWLALGGGALDGAEHAGFATPMLRTACLVLLLLSLFPTRLPPSPAAVAYCEQVIADVGRDVRAGRRVLIDRGTMPLILAGVEEPPRDTSITMLEMMWAGNPGDPKSGTRERLATWQYDRLYVARQTLFPVELQRYHRIVDHIRPPEATHFAKLFPFEWGGIYWTWYTSNIDVWEPTDDTTVEDPGPDGSRQHAARLESVARRHALAARQSPDAG